MGSLLKYDVSLLILCLLAKGFKLLIFANLLMIALVNQGLYRFRAEIVLIRLIGYQLKINFLQTEFSWLLEESFSI